MSATPNPISPLRQRMLEDMRMRKLGEKTQAGYLRAVRDFNVFLGRSPANATAEDVRRYQLHLADRGVSAVSINAALTGLRFFFDITLDRVAVMAKVAHVHQPRKLPEILGVEEVTRFLEAAPGLKYRAALSVAYGAGLRASEVVSLKVGDIDSERMSIRVEQGKGHRDRYAMLSPTLLEVLRRGGAKDMLGAGCCRADGCSRGRTRWIRCRPVSSIGPVMPPRTRRGSPSESRFTR
jgi:site-specific recombinase XerD